MPEDQDQNQNNQTNNQVSPANPVPPAPPASDDNVPEPVIPPVAPEPAPEAPAEPTEGDAPSVMADVASKITEANNILIALSKNPTVDEMAAAIGLSLCLDRGGKRTTAIYSGTTPNALEFLKPEETFESSTDTLQDFVIAISKEKADHLRYKLDGDYVKIYITPYKTRIDEEDLDFSYGDYNVDLVLALNVKNGSDLDDALREHGRIMHDASVVNITTDLPGKFGEIEWSDGEASSVSEMIARLIYGMKQKIPMEQDEATAFLTGIIAATDRFSSAKTTPETMQMASKLMASGADQQLISQNITAETDEQFIGSLDNHPHDDPTSLSVEHEKEEEPKPKEEIKEEPKEEAPKEEAPKEEEPKEEEPKPETPEFPSVDTTENKSLLDDLKAAEDALSEPTPAPTPAFESILAPTPISTSEPAPLEPPTEKTIEPSSDFVNESLGEGTNKYGQMLEEALAESDNMNPAMSAAPEVPSAPEINGVPEINYMPLPDDEVLPPPPTPPINMDASAMPEMPAVAMPTPEPAPEPTPEPTPATPPLEQPAMQDQVYIPQANDPSAFKIPGM